MECRTTFRRFVHRRRRQGQEAPACSRAYHAKLSPLEAWRSFDKRSLHSNLERKVFTYVVYLQREATRIDRDRQSSCRVAACMQQLSSAALPALGVGGVRKRLIEFRVLTLSRFSLTLSPSPPSSARPPCLSHKASSTQFEVHRTGFPRTHEAFGLSRASRTCTYGSSVSHWNHLMRVKVRLRVKHGTASSLK